MTAEPCCLQAHQPDGARRCAARDKITASEGVCVEHICAGAVNVAAADIQGNGTAWGPTRSSGFPVQRSVLVVRRCILLTLRHVFDEVEELLAAVDLRLVVSVPQVRGHGTRGDV